MDLRNPFPEAVRELYRGVWYCWLCRQNGTATGGLELHHIVGRDSNSALNSALLCHHCHAKMCHSIEEEQHLFYLTLRFLFAKGYSLIEKDLLFIQKYGTRLISEKAHAFLKS